MKIINRYLWKEVTLNIFMIMLGLIAMFSFFDLLQELDSLGKGHYGVSKMLLFVVLSAPGHIYDIAPVAVLVGTMYCLGQFARNSELIILRVSGLSIWDIGFSLLRIALVFVLMTFLIGELITPLSEKVAQRLRISATDSVVAQDFRSGLWIKDGTSFVNVETVLPDATLLNLHIYEFDKNFKLKVIKNAKEAKFENKQWDLSEMTQTLIGNNEVKTIFLSKANWQSLIRPELLNVLLIMPEKMSVWDLQSFIQHLKINHQNTKRYDIALWVKIIYPLACFVMILLALPFGFLHQRSSAVTTKIFIGVLLGISYQLLNRVFIHLGRLNDWPALFSAITPTLLFMTIAFGMILMVERR